MRVRSAIRTRVEQHAGLSPAGNSYDTIALGPQLGLADIELSAASRFELLRPTPA